MDFIIQYWPLFLVLALIAICVIVGTLQRRENEREIARQQSLINQQRTIEWRRQQECELARARYLSMNLASANYTDIDNAILSYATKMAKKDFESKGKPIYKRKSNGVLTNDYKADFLNKRGQYNAKLRAACLCNNVWSIGFRDYLTMYAPTATIGEAEKYVGLYVNFLKEKKKNKPSLTKIDVKVSPVVNTDTKSNKKPDADENMLVHKFVRLANVNSFRDNFAKHYGYSEISGVYLIYNSMRDKWYVGQGQKAVSRCLSHFKGGNDNAPDIYRDFLSGDVFYINFIKLSATDFNTLDELEYHYIGYYHAVYPNGYNTLRGNRTNR